MRLKNAFRISQQQQHQQQSSSFPMQTRSMSLPPVSSHQRFDDIPHLSSRPLSCVVERPMDVVSLQEEEDTLMDNAIPAEFEYANADLMPSSPGARSPSFDYEQQTEWVDTGKHWYSFPFTTKSNAVAPTETSSSSSSSSSSSNKEGGILKYPDVMPTTVLGKRSESPQESAFSAKKKKRTPVIRFDQMVQVHSTYSHQDYNRHPDPDAICTRLNATLAHQIKKELNLFKTTEMPIHEQSQLYTQIF
jgi:hypothetical protein